MEQKKYYLIELAGIDYPIKVSLAQYFEDVKTVIKNDIEKSYPLSEFTLGEYEEVTDPYTGDLDHMVGWFPVYEEGRVNPRFFYHVYQLPVRY